MRFIFGHCRDCRMQNCVSLQRGNVEHITDTCYGTVSGITTNRNALNEIKMSFCAKKQNKTKQTNAIRNIASRNAIRAEYRARYRVYQQTCLNQTELLRMLHLVDSENDALIYTRRHFFQYHADRGDIRLSDSFTNCRSLCANLQQENVVRSSI